MHYYINKKIDKPVITKLKVKEKIYEYIRHFILLNIPNIF